MCKPGYGDSVVLQIAIDRSGFRRDGKPRANAVPEHPGVILSFESVHGPLSYPCDSYDRWTDNLRAIALSMEALRRVDRYGVTRNGEQYRGFAALEAPGVGDSGPMSQAQAEAVIREHAPYNPGELTLSLSTAYRRARRYTHPDSNDGDQSAWDQVEAAALVLGLRNR